MSRAKVVITIEKETLSRLDQLVAQHVFPSRSSAIQEAVQEKIERMRRERLARECAKLEPEFEKALAEEGHKMNINEWPSSVMDLAGAWKDMPLVEEGCADLASDVDREEL